VKLGLKKGEGHVQSLQAIWTLLCRSEGQGISGLVGGKRGIESSVSLQRPRTQPHRLLSLPQISLTLLSRVLLADIWWRMDTESTVKVQVHTSISSSH